MATAGNDVYSSAGIRIHTDTDSITHMHGLAVCVKEGFPIDTYLCFQLAFLHSVLLLFPQ